MRGGALALGQEVSECNAVKRHKAKQAPEADVALSSLDERKERDRESGTLGNRRERVPAFLAQPPDDAAEIAERDVERGLFGFILIGLRIFRTNRGLASRVSHGSTAHSSVSEASALRQLSSTTAPALV